MNPLKTLSTVELADELCTSHPELTRAISSAAYLHNGQTRSAPRAGMKRPPYVEHPLRVASRLSRIGAKDSDLLNSAVLHDVVEDCSEKIATTKRDALVELATRFGETATSTIARLTINEETTYMQQVSAAISADPRALLVKVSDWIDNAGSLHHLPNLPTRLVKKYQPLADVFLYELDHASNEVDHLLQGNSQELQKKVVRVGERLIDLSRRSQHPDLAEGPAAQQSAQARPAR